MKIVVLAGGLSPERDVSLSSGSLVANTLRKAGHRVLLLDVYEGISAKENKYEGISPNDKNFEKLFRDNTGEPDKYVIPEIAPDLAEIRKRNNNGNALIGPNVLRLCQSADVVFIALHGAMGENGQIQAVFDAMGIKYTGTGYAGSLLAMDKDLTKRLLRQAGIPTAGWLVYNDSISLEKTAEQIGLPCVVKPCSAGSSIGVSIAHDFKELKQAISTAKEVESHIMIETMVEGREFSAGILAGKALPVIEITPKEGFYDYRNKYQLGLTNEICPADLPECGSKRMQEVALEVHRVLRLGSYARIDFIMDKRGEFICLEANTLPGMTPTSLLPQEALTDGISYEELCNRIVSLAMG